MSVSELFQFCCSQGPSKHGPAFFFDFFKAAPIASDVSSFVTILKEHFLYAAQKQKWMVLKGLHAWERYCKTFPCLPTDGLEEKKHLWTEHNWSDLYTPQQSSFKTFISLFPYMLYIEPELFSGSSVTIEHHPVKKKHVKLSWAWPFLVSCYTFTLLCNQQKHPFFNSLTSILWRLKRSLCYSKILLICGKSSQVEKSICGWDSKIFFHWRG